MLCSNQKFKIKWNNTNKDWYISKGYKYTKRYDEFYVDIKDLMKGSKVKVKCICDYCGSVYECYYYAYNKSHKQICKDACRNCSGKKNSDTSKQKRIEKNYQKILSICNQKGYILLSPMEQLDDVRNKKIKIKCNRHGVFEINIANFIAGHGCYLCGRESSKKKNLKNIDDVELYINSFNNNILLNKDEFEGVCVPNLKVKCGNCGSVFTTSLHIYKKTSHKCHNCSPNSIGEAIIKNELNNFNIRFIEQKKFDDCRDKKPLPFDFYIPDYNMCIEFQGEQHYRPIDYFGGIESYNILKYHDEIKRDYCNNKHMKLLEIKYDQISEITNILKDNICFA